MRHENEEGDGGGADEEKRRTNGHPARLDVRKTYDCHVKYTYCIIHRVKVISITARSTGRTSINQRGLLSAKENKRNLSFLAIFLSRIPAAAHPFIEMYF